MKVGVIVSVGSISSVILGRLRAVVNGGRLVDVDVLGTVVDGIGVEVDILVVVVLAVLLETVEVNIVLVLVDAIVDSVVDDATVEVVGSDVIAVLVIGVALDIVDDIVVGEVSVIGCVVASSVLVMADGDIVVVASVDVLAG